MKTTIKHLTATTFIALFLMAGVVKAEGTEKIATNKVLETSLQLENWMTSEKIWNTGVSEKNNTELETETEMQIENWMTSEKVWDNLNRVKETETELIIETWMKNENIWNR